MLKPDAPRPTRLLIYLRMVTLEGSHLLRSVSAIIGLWDHSLTIFRPCPYDTHRRCAVQGSRASRRPWNGGIALLTGALRGLGPEVARTFLSVDNSGPLVRHGSITARIITLGRSPPAENAQRKTPPLKRLFLFYVSATTGGAGHGRDGRTATRAKRTSDYRRSGHQAVLRLMPLQPGNRGPGPLL